MSPLRSWPLWLPIFCALCWCHFVVVARFGEEDITICDPIQLRVIGQYAPVGDAYARLLQSSNGEIEYWGVAENGTIPNVAEVMCNGALASDFTECYRVWNGNAMRSLLQPLFCGSFHRCAW